MHRRSHTGEKPYKCHICNHACTQASKLKRHMKTHMNKSPGSTLSEDAASRQSSNSTPDSNAKSEVKEEDEDDFGQGEEEEHIEGEEEEPMEEEDAHIERCAGVVKPSTSTSSPNASHQSVLDEVMQKIGLNNIQQYSEAYKAAVEESIKQKEDISENGVSEDRRRSTNTDDHKPSVSSSEADIPSHQSAPYSLRRCNTETRCAAATLSAVTPTFSGHMGLRGNGFDPPVSRVKMEFPDHHPSGPSDMEAVFRNLWYPHRDMYVGQPSSVLELSKQNQAVESALKSDMVAAAGPSSGTGTTPRPKDRGKNDTCEYCGKVFKNCSNLTVHRRSHTGEKPYKCQLCAYACAQSSKLTRHMKTHGRLGKDVFRCRFCDMPFSVPSTLEKHMRKCVVNQKTAGGACRFTTSDTDSKDATTPT